MKVTIVGPGAVGMAIAYTLVAKEIAREILLVGRNCERAAGEALDLAHAQSFLSKPMSISSGDIADAVGSEIVVICAAVPDRSPLRDRNQFAQANEELMREILPQVAEAAPDCKLLIVSNPVDSLTWLAQKITGFPHQRVMGTGTLVDSFRFRELLSKALNIHPGDLRAYILGEHGESQFPAMSVALAGGELIVDTEEVRALSSRAKASGIEVYNQKGNTCYAIAQAATLVIKSILNDERNTIPLSVAIDGFLGIEDACLSLPVVVGRNGIERILHPNLSASEQDAFRYSARVVRETIKSFQGKETGVQRD